jgi:hypothetical protein
MKVTKLNILMNHVYHLDYPMTRIRHCHFTEQFVEICELISGN